MLSRLNVDRPIQIMDGLKIRRVFIASLVYDNTGYIFNNINYFKVILCHEFTCEFIQTYTCP